MKKQNINKIIEISLSNLSPKDQIKQMLEYCPHSLIVEFVYNICLDIKHLMKDERSLAVVTELKQVMDTGKPFSEEIASAAYAAASASYAATAASVATSAATASASASYVTAVATAAASYASAATIAYIEQQEKLFSYLTLLKQLIVKSLPKEKTNFLLEALI